MTPDRTPPADVLTVPGCITSPGRKPVVRDSWEAGLRALHAFCRKYGHCYVAPCVLYRGFPLGRWVVEQRRAHARGALTKHQSLRLEALPHWDWCRTFQRWPRGFSRLQVFVLEHGHSRVPSGYTTKDGFRLGTWVRNTKHYRREDRLTSEQISLLDNLPGWVWPHRTDTWGHKAALLAEFAAEHGHVRVPSGHVCDGVRLRPWTTRQATRWALLTDDQRSRLVALPGWDELLEQHRWERCYAAVFDTLTRSSAVNLSAEMEAWAVEQRDAQRDETLSPERITRLEAIPNWECYPVPVQVSPSPEQESQTTCPRYRRRGHTTHQLSEARS